MESGNSNYRNFDFIESEKINIIFRPQSDTSHYASDKSKNLEIKILEKFKNNDTVNLILFPRDKRQQRENEEYFKSNHINYIIPKGITQGPSLIRVCDLIISGGGTMAREASVLDVPSYSFFGGKLGQVDKYLISKGKMIHIDNEEQINTIKLEKNISKEILGIKKNAFLFVIQYIENILNQN